VLADGSAEPRFRVDLLGPRDTAHLATPKLGSVNQAETRAEVAAEVGNVGKPPAALAAVELHDWIAERR
jgi:hypothetical protein